MEIKNILIREIFDSRDQSTIEVDIKDKNGRAFRAEVPAGKSTGRNEVQVFSFPKAQAALRSLKTRLLHKSFNTISEFDGHLLEFDSTSNKRRIGGNLSLGLSIAFAKALAFQTRLETWQRLTQEFFKGQKGADKPLIFSNFFNGGAHAHNSLDIQEYLVVAKVKKSVTETVRKLITFYQRIGDYLRLHYKLLDIPIGDESGYSLNFPDNFEPIKILEKQVQAAGLSTEFRLGLDTAASNFYKDGGYYFGGRQIQGGDLLRIYLNYFQRSKLLFSIEDPFQEEDFMAFKELFARLKSRWVVGDDLTTTNESAIRNFAVDKLINAVIIKPNQIGTVTQTCQAIKAAREHNLKIIVSHRSGETEDNFIIHLARASKADGVKLGAPLHERMYKFDELIRIYDN